jgi:hypothetical protein
MENQQSSTQVFNRNFNIAPMFLQSGQASFQQHFKVKLIDMKHNMKYNDVIKTFHENKNTPFDTGSKRERTEKSISIRNIRQHSTIFSYRYLSGNTRDAEK